MLYIKAELTPTIEMKIDLYEDEIFSACPECGKEYLVDREDLIDILTNKDCDFSGTSIFCADCAKAFHARRLNAHEKD